MAFAAPPNYTGKVKPKKKAVVARGISAAGSYRPGATPNRPNPLLRRPAGPASAVPPAATAQQPVQPLTPPPLPAPKAPPMTPGAANDRITATEQYGTTLADTNEQLRELALQYGGAPTVQQFGQTFDPTTNQVTDTTSVAPVTANDPLSALATLERQYGQNQRAIGENANANNTFFSGLQLRDQQLNTDERARGVTAAQRDYESKVAQLTRLLQAAQGTRGEAFRNAALADLLAAPPAEPMADEAPVETQAPASVAPPPPGPPRPMSTFQASRLPAARPAKKPARRKGKK